LFLYISSFVLSHSASHPLPRHAPPRPPRPPTPGISAPNRRSTVTTSGQRSRQPPKDAQKRRVKTILDASFRVDSHRAFRARDGPFRVELLIGVTWLPNRSSRASSTSSGHVLSSGKGTEPETRTVFRMASPALLSVQANSHGPGPVAMHQPAPTHLQSTMQHQQQQHQQQQHQQQQHLQQQHQQQQHQQQQHQQQQHHQQQHHQQHHQHQHQQQYTPVPVSTPRHQSSNGNGPHAPLVVSDLAQQPNRSSPLADDDGQKAQRLHEDYNKLCAVLEKSDPVAIRRAIRDKHKKCLLGSHYHTAFLMNVTMHHSDGAILQRSVRDFGSNIVAAAKHDLVDLMSQSDLDELADKIISKASNTFLDKALVARLPTIEARRLVNALARAERLGYDANDVVKNESVIPSMPPRDAPKAKAHNPGQRQLPHDPPGPTVAQALAHMSPHPLESVDPSIPRCPTCQRGFPGPAAYDHRTLCTRPAPPPGPGGEMYICPFCAQGLSTIGGLHYHMMNKVCGDHGDITKDRIVPTMPLARLNPSTKRPAPITTPAYVSSVNNSPTPQHFSTAPAMQTPRAAPPSTLPDSSGSVPLGTPQAKDMAHLTASQVHSLKEELRLAEESFKIKINDTQRAGGDADEVQKRITSLRNSYACKQSIIRKKYNIRLRQRRGRDEMEQERLRMGIPDNVPRAAGTPTSDVHVDKRARVDDSGDATTTTTTTTTAMAMAMATQDSRHDTPTKIVAASQVSDGLQGSDATAATQDPTASASQSEPSRPSSSYQQNGYRVEVHVPSPSKRPPSSAAAVGGIPLETASVESLTADRLLQQMRGASANGDDGDGNNSSSSDDDSSTDDED
ncbi:hypothetical protein LY76DRAFT_402115, partial [Colletotrichum caudatum]